MSDTDNMAPERIMDNYSDSGTAERSEQPPTIDFPAAALHLARTYGNLITTRDNIRKLLAHRQVFTKDMAIEELLSITPGSGGEHVQTSNQSDQTARIAEKLASGYVEKRQKQLEWEAARNVEELAYAEWKIGIVEAAMQERMSSKERWFFRNLFVKRRTYRSIREDNPGKGRIYDRDINGIRKEVLRALEGQIRLLNAGMGDSRMMHKLNTEMERERRQST